MEPIENLVVIRGGGDLATGIIQKFFRCGIPVLVLEVPKPTAIRRTVALCEAVYAGSATVEDMTCRRIDSVDEIKKCISENIIPLLVDPTGEMISEVKPDAVIDAIVAKRNLGTYKSQAPITIALGPGFIAGIDVDAVIETMRGHDLGRLILEGTAIPNTGIPGEIGGKGKLRVIHAHRDGEIRHNATIGTVVSEGETVFTVDGENVSAPFTGLLRGLIREGFYVKKGMKIADIDPRTTVDWKTISDKARCLGGAALEAYLYIKKQKEIV